MGALPRILVADDAPPIRDLVGDVLREHLPNASLKPSFDGRQAMSAEDALMTGSEGCADHAVLETLEAAAGSSRIPPSVTSPCWSAAPAISGPTS